MTCTEIELALLEPERSIEVDEHLASCASCQAFARDLGQVISLASLPEPTARELSALEGLAEATHAAWQRRESPRRSWLGFATAACLGALVSASAFWATRPVREVVIERPVLAVNDEPNLLADEVFFEVTWPEVDVADDDLTLEGEDP